MNLILVLPSLSLSGPAAVDEERCAQYETRSGSINNVRFVHVRFVRRQRIIQFDYNHDDLKWVPYLVFPCMYVCMYVKRVASLLEVSPFPSLIAASHFVCM